MHRYSVVSAMKVKWFHLLLCCWIKYISLIEYLVTCTLTLRIQFMLVLFVWSIDNFYSLIYNTFR